MSQKLPTAALIFDFDGLIIDSEHAWIQAWIDVYRAHGLTPPLDAFIAQVGHADTTYNPVDALVAALGKTANPAALEAEARESNLRHVEKLPILPGILDWLDRAQSLGLKLGISSNSPHWWIDRHLDRLKLTKFFAAVSCRDDVARGKPFPDVYARTAEKLGVAPARAIALEDSHPGVTAAKAAGLRCIAVANPHTLRHDLSAADIRLTSLAQLTLDDALERLG